MRRAAFVTVGLVVAAATLLWLVFWVLRGWPDVPVCHAGLSGSEQRAVDAFQRGSGWLHLSAAVLVVVAIWRLAAARRGAARPGRATLALLAMWSVLYVVALVEPEALLTGVFAWVAFVTFPLGLLLLVAALPLLAAARTARAGATVVLVLAWLVLVVLVPSHAYGVASVGEPFCMS
jgi:hypothetical protein